MENKDARQTNEKNAQSEVETKSRALLRGIAVGVLLFLLVFRVLILPLIQQVSNTEIRDDGYVLGLLIGAILLLLGFEAGPFLPGGFGGKK